MKAFKWLAKADKEKFAIGAFNCANLETFKAITQAAVNLKSPIILEASDGEINYIGYKQIVALARTFEDEYQIPIIINLDHGKDFDSCKKAIEAGFDYIHFDGGQMPYEESVRETIKVVEMAHKANLPVEGEIDHIQGSSADHTSEDPNTIFTKEMLTSPERAKKFVDATGVDVLAGFYGNLHGVYKTSMHLHLDLLKAAKELLPQTYFSLHGGSGVFEEDVKKSIEYGIVKINVNSDMRIAFRMSLEKTLAESNEVAIYKIMDKPIKEVQKVVESKINLFKSNGKI